MNSKMRTKSQLSTTELKKKKIKTKRSKQLENHKNHRNGRNHRNGDPTEGYQWGGGRGRMGERVQRIRSINGR